MFLLQNSLKSTDHNY